MNDQIIEEFRSNNGVVGGFFDGVPLLLLHNVGAKSGTKRVNPLVYAQHGNSYVVAASKGGADTHPDWYFNVKANPEVTIEVGDQTVEAQARILEDGDERTQLYAKLEQKLASFSEYKVKAERVIPIVVLEPIA